MTQILGKAAAKSVILGRKNQKKVLQNPGGTDRTKGKISGLEDFAVSDRSSILMASDG